MCLECSRWPSQSEGYFDYPKHAVILLSDEAPIQGHKNTAGLFSVRILLLLSIFACARSYGELIGIHHASCIFFFAFLSMAVSPSL